jgi:heme-degrading monooxygenase HmoA
VHDNQKRQEEFMIVRTWRGRAAPSNPDAYPAHFRHNVLPELRHIAGFRGASLLREDGADAIEFLVLTRWESMDAVRTFAGADPGHAVVEPEAAAALVSYDRRVRHYQVVEETASR